ncbi:MAG: hypothetical protein J6B22_01120 [Clostridia bacterium]|nr:hypothetical protein [Clostridia bacterium]
MKDKKKMSHMTYVHTTDNEPDTAFDLVNFYGTYEIQKTADAPNTYPAIAQGFNKKQSQNDRQNPHSKKEIW